jgi:2-polyprenyl-3-methyl-5-hydroxy-6-metoxy-1,4-benzoquinol methylase
MPTCYYCDSNINTLICPKVSDDFTATLMSVQRNVYKCNNCGLYFTYPLPTQCEIDEFYSNIYNLKRWERSVTIDRLIKWADKYKYYRSISYLNILFYPFLSDLIFYFRRDLNLNPVFKVLPKKRGILNLKRAVDIGCAQGGFVAELMINGYLAEGIEPSKDFVSALRKKGVKNIFEGKLEDFRFIHKYDLVYLKSTMMCLLNLKQNFKTVSGLVKPEGYLILDEYNSDCMDSFDNLRCPHYLNGINLQFMKTIYKDSGFSQIKSFFYEDNENSLNDVEFNPDFIKTKRRVVYLLKKR